MGVTHEKLAVTWAGEELELEEAYPVHDDLEDAVNLAAICVPDYMRRCPPGLAPQPWMLMVVRALGELRNGGRRDKPFEDAAMRRIITDQGFEGLGGLFGVTLEDG